MTTAAESRPRKPKKCQQCKGDFAPRSPMQKVCGIKCALAYAEAHRTAAAKRERAAERKAIREAKQKAKRRGDWLREAQAEFNKFIRARDRAAGYPCISSGRPLDWTANKVDAGHYRSVGSAPHLRFDERNCHAQSKQDNRYGSGCAVDYRIGLIARIGLEAVEALEADQSTKHYSIEDLKQIKATYIAKRKEIEQC